MNPIFHLYQLQKIDTQLDQINTRLAEIETIISQDVRIQQAQKSVDDAHQVTQKARHALKLLEESVQTKQIKKQQSEASLYGGKIKNPKELQDLEREIATLKKSIQTLEDQQIDAMVEVEKTEAIQKDTEKQLQVIIGEVGGQRAGLMGEQSQLIRNRERLQVEISAVKPQIPESDYEKYQQLRKQKRGIAVTSVIDQACSACGSTLTPSEYQQARNPIALIYCKTCGRLLYAG